MGCASSVHNADGKLEPVPANKKVSARSLPTTKRVYEEVSVAESAPCSQWEAGYLLDEREVGPVNTYEDYRGFAVTISTNASKNKADVVCRWADVALEERDKEGGIFFNPQNPSVWPHSLLAMYDAYFTDQFANPSAVRAKKNRSDAAAAKGVPTGEHDSAAHNTANGSDELQGDQSGDTDTKRHRLPQVSLDNAAKDDGVAK